MLLGGIASLSLVALLVIGFRDLGYKSGMKDGHTAGYDQGRKDADNWWLGVESQADQARQQIWREEAER